MPEAVREALEELLHVVTLTLTRHVTVIVATFGVALDATFHSCLRRGVGSGDAILPGGVLAGVFAGGEGSVGLLDG
jgi:hypothetical protein